MLNIPKRPSLTKCAIPRLDERLRSKVAFKGCRIARCTVRVALVAVFDVDWEPDPLFKGSFQDQNKAVHVDGLNSRRYDPFIQNSHKEENAAEAMIANTVQANFFPSRHEVRLVYQKKLLHIHTCFRRNCWSASPQNCKRHSTIQNPHLGNM